jgi:predicted transcriptional regulator
MPEALALETRRRIFEHVRRFPGTHLREIQRALGLQPGELEYHLHTLEKAGLLAATAGARRTYVVAALVPHPDKPVLALLRQGAVRRLLIAMLEKPGVSFQELHALAGGAKSTLSFHLRKVTETGLVAVEKRGRENRYSVREPGRVAALLVTYRASFLDEAVDRFAELWLGLGPGGNVEEPGAPGREA